MKAIRCKLIVHGQCMQFDCGEFDSITEAKEFIKYDDRPYTIIKLKSDSDD